MLKKAILLYNALSGSQSIQGKLDQIANRFIRQGIILHLFPVTQGTNEMITKLFQEKPFMYDFVILSGGDGTINALTTHMLNHNINVPIAIIPYGTFNDFARCLGIPQDLDKCMDIILGGKTSMIDVGRVNGNKYFLDTCAGGLFVDVSIKTPTVYKRHFGSLAYYINGLSELTNLNPFQISIETDKQQFDGKVLLFMIMNGKHAGGFEHLVEDADMSDGTMDMIIIKDCSYIDLANLLIKILNRSFISDPHVVHIPLKTCSIEGDSSLSITMDGEDGGNLPLEIEVLHQALEFFIK